MVRKEAVRIFQTLQESYGWRANRYEEDAKDWKKMDKLNVANYYQGRSVECRAMVKEIGDIINSLKLT